MAPSAGEGVSSSEEKPIARDPVGQNESSFDGALPELPPYLKGLVRAPKRSLFANGKLAVQIIWFNDPGVVGQPCSRMTTGPSAGPASA